MSETIENPPAFPQAPCVNPNGEVVTGGYYSGEAVGMSLRDYFAAKATDDDILEYMDEGYTREEAKFAYADNMLRARTTSQPTP